MAEFKKVITNKGQELITTAAFDSGELAVKYIVIGDANGESYEPSPEQTALVNQRNKLLITERIVNSPTRYTFLVQIPQDIDYYIIREIGLVDENDNLIEIAQMEQETYIQSDNLVQQLTIGIQIDVGQSSTVIVLADTNIETASKDFVNNSFQNLNQKGQANGYAGLDANAKLPIIHIPTGVELTANKDVANGYCGLNNNSQIPSVNIPNITNCIIETPQNLFWEDIENGVRLKAGSKITIPNGFEEDGTTLKFDEIVTTEDLDYTYTYTYTGKGLICLNITNGYLTTFGVSSSMSGSTQPTTASLWYNTTGNIVTATDSSGQLSDYVYSLPLGVYDRSTQKLIQSFNHMGFIGSTVFVDKGVKGLIPNGRNADGSLKNIEYTTPTVLTRTWTTQNNNYDIYIYEDNTFTYSQPVDRLSVNNFGELPVLTSGGKNAYVKDENTYYVSYSSNNYKWTPIPYGNYVVVGNINIESGKITKLTPVNTFRALDFNDQHLPQVDGQWVMSRKEIIVNGIPPTIEDVSFDLSTYLPNDGNKYEVLFSGAGTTGKVSGNLQTIILHTDLQPYNVYLYIAQTRTTSTIYGAGSVILPVGTGRTVSVNYSTSNTGTYSLYALGYRRIGTNS